MIQSYGKLPLSFERNQGQTDAQAKFLSRGKGYTLFLTGDEAVFSLRGNRAGKARLPSVSPAVSKSRRTSSRAPQIPDATLRMKLVNANPAAEIVGTDELPGKSNYFLGNDPKQWRNNVPTYAKVKSAMFTPALIWCITAIKHSWSMTLSSRLEPTRAK